MFCTNCGNKILTNSKFCTECGLELPNIVIKSKQGKIRTILPVIATILTILLIVGYLNYKESRDKQEAKNVLLDSINNTQTSSVENIKYTEALKKLFNEIKSKNANLIRIDKEIENSDILKPSSYKDINAIKKYITLLSQYVEEINKAELNFQYIKNNARGILSTANLSNEELDVVIEGFNETANDPNLEVLRVKRNQDLAGWAIATKNLYVFMQNKFKDIRIELNENNEEQVFFASQKNADEFNKLVEDVNLKSIDFSKSDAEFLNYSNQKLQNLGLDISAEEINKSIYK